MTLDDELLSRARELAFARKEGLLVGELPREELGADPVAAAYRLQEEAIHAYAVPVVGWKIGATSPAAREIMQTDAPFYGPLFEDAVFEGGATLPLPPGLFGVEVEIVLRLGRDLPRGNAYTEADVEAAVASVHPAMEIVAWRQLLQATADAVLAIPDFALSHALVLGEGVADWRGLDLIGAAAACTVNGAHATEGRGGDALGGPLAALLWLAENGPGLKAGDVVATGTITGLAPAKPGDEVVGEVAGLGTVRMTAAAD
ncbi:MAG: fumarylacetoacetate hydrolase family protein [Geminicoccaceae bacterium]|nr:fumarylacetoacetate hydrolase family protein [Geminicoccaceae bacterium]